MRNRPGSGQIGSVDDRTGEDIQARSLEFWSYPFGRFFVYYAFAFEPPNKWKQAASATNEGRLNSWLELQNRAESWGAQDEEIYKARLAGLKSIKQDPKAPGFRSCPGRWPGRISFQVRAPIQLTMSRKTLSRPSSMDRA
jgi:hypothetical protein